MDEDALEELVRKAGILRDDLEVLERRNYSGLVTTHTDDLRAVLDLLDYAQEAK